MCWEGRFFEKWSKNIFSNSERFFDFWRVGKVIFFAYERTCSKCLKIGFSRFANGGPFFDFWNGGKAVVLYNVLVTPFPILLPTIAR